MDFAKNKGIHMILCVGPHGELTFNKRRVSRDATVLCDILKTMEEEGQPKLYLTEYSKKLFLQPITSAPELGEKKTTPLELFGIKPEALLTTERPVPEMPKKNTMCFLESSSDIFEYAKLITKVTLYRWDKDYPADDKFDIDAFLTENGCSKIECLSELSTFPGTSHEKITKEIYSYE